MTSDPICILLALPDADVAPFKAAATDLDAEVAVARDRAEAVDLARTRKPAVAVVELSGASRMGGGALVQVLRQTVPGIRTLAVADDGERPFLEGMLAADTCVQRPLDSGVVTFALRTALTRTRLNNTAQYRLRKGHSHDLTADALDGLGRRLAGVHGISEVGEIVKGVLADVIDYSLFVFCPAPVEKRLNPRVYVDDRVSTDRYADALEIIARLCSETWDLSASAVVPGLYGQIDSSPDPLPPQPLEGKSWPMRSASGETVGVAAVLRESGRKLPEPVSQLCGTVASHAGLFLGRLVEARNEQVALLNAVSQAIGEGMIWIEPRRQYTVVNRAARLALAMPETGPVSRDEVYGRLREVGLFDDFFGSGAARRQLILKSANLPGAAGHYRLDLVRVRDPRGVVRGAFLLLRRADASSREAIDAALEEFSHDLRAPLNAVVGYGEVLLQEIDGPLSTGQCSSVERMLEAARKIDGLVEYTLTHRTARRELKKQAIGTHELLQSVVADFEPAARRQKIDIDLTVRSGADRLRVDVNQMHVALSNLISNALKFSPDYSAITITARRAPASIVARLSGESSISDAPLPGSRVHGSTSRLRRGFVELTCSDQGPGVLPDDRDRIFQRFVQASQPARPPRDDGDRGTGLGLAITRDIIEAHGGVIEVDSPAPARPGATFRILIPGGYEMDDA